MKSAFRGKWLGVLALAGMAFVLPARPAAAQVDPGGPPPATADAPAGAQVLTRGPIHEAFAEPVVFDPRPGPVVPKAPPPPVEEAPPDQKPEGANVQWIPGYWAWDDSRGDFLWVSGLWRDIPPGRQWVPGYWAQADGGSRWVAGAWTSTVQEEVQYYPVPPQTLEAGPSSPQPSANSVWSPGYWDWRGDRFAWRPGFWVGFQPDWVWVPAHYVWTPSGYLFVDGYWDLPFARRGTPFAPVYFAQPVYQQPQFVYTPTISLLASALVTSLFVRPSYHQYYFGDYYAPNYAQAGFLPWYSFHQGRRGYDPLFAHYAVVQGRRDPRWLDRLQDDYRFRRDHPDARPPHTYVEQQRIVNRTTVNNINVTNGQNSSTNVRNVVLARPIAQVAASPDQPLRFTKVDAAQRQALARQAGQLRDFRQQRLQQEVQATRLPAGVNVRDRARDLAGPATSPGPDSRPRRVERFRSPIGAPPAQPLAGTNPVPRPPDQGGLINEARQQRLEQLKGRREQLEQLKGQRQREQLGQVRDQQQRLEQLKGQRQQQLEQLKARPPREPMEPLKGQRQQLEQLKVQRQQQLEQLKGQRQQQQLEQLKGQRQREQLEQLKGQQQRPQLEQLKAQRQQQLEQLNIQQQRQQMERLKGQQQRPQLEQLQMQRQQQLEQLKAQQRSRVNGGERPPGTKGADAGLNPRRGRGAPPVPVPARPPGT